MFDIVSEKLQNIFTSLKGITTLNDENIKLALDEVKKAFIEADVSLKSIKKFVSKVEEKAKGKEVTSSISPKEQFIKIINDELIELLGGRDAATQRLYMPDDKKLAVILILGLQGSGKTTTCAKLANLFKKKGLNPLLVPLDLKRPAAIEQLKILGKQINIPVYTNVGMLHATSLQAQNAIDYAKQNNHNVVILDSAGRLQIDTEMMAELLLIDRTIQPNEKLLVIDSMIGQEAANVASSFDTQIGITGIILTKLDGDARGGAALSIVEEINKPIKLVGVGEKLNDIQEFYPDRMASRILGMGDVLTLVEQAEEKIKEDEARELERKLFNEFNLETFLQMQNTMGKLGNLSSIFNMMGMGSMLNQMGANLNKEQQEKFLNQSEVKMKKFKSAIHSMTEKERVDPDIINLSRITRIARGAGLKVNDVDTLINEFKKMKKMIDKVKPLVGMLKGQASVESLLGSMGGKSALQNPSFLKPNLQKGFKPKKKS